MLKSAAFQLSGVNVNNPDLPILTPYVAGIEYRYRMLAVSGSKLPDSSPVGNDATLFGGISPNQVGLPFTGDSSQYADTGVLTDGSFTILGVVRPRVVNSGVPVGTFELISGDNYRVGTVSPWFTQSGENPGLSCSIAVVDTADATKHRNFTTVIPGVAYTPGQWCLFAHQYDAATRTQRLVVGDINTRASTSHSASERFSASPENTRIGRCPGGSGYPFNGDIAYTAQWDSMLSLEDLKNQFDAVRSDLSRRGIVV